MQSSGWSVSGPFNGINTLGGKNKCKSSHFHAYRNGNSVGVVSKIMHGSGSAKLEYGNCWDSGNVNVYLNGKKINSAPKYVQKSVDFSFSDGDKLEVKDEDGNAVIQLIRLRITCGTNLLPSRLIVWLHFPLATCHPRVTAWTVIVPSATFGPFRVSCFVIPHRMTDAKTDTALNHLSPPGQPTAVDVA